MLLPVGIFFTFFALKAERAKCFIGIKALRLIWNYGNSEQSEEIILKELWIDGHFIEVTDEVYAAYVKGQRKIDYFEKDLKTERVIKEKDGNIKEIVPSREDSLNRLIDDNSMQFSYDSKSVECEVEINVDLEKLHIALQQLTAEELDIIKKVFFENMTEREIAKLLGISQVAVNKRKHRILEKLKKIIENKN